MKGPIRGTFERALARSDRRLRRLSRAENDATDYNAFHDDVAGEVHALGEKTVLASADELLIEDAADSYAKKRVRVGNLLSVGDLIAAMQGLPGLRGLWPMSAFDASGNAQDLSGHGHHLTRHGSALYAYDGLAPYIRLSSGQYLSRPDEADLDITGAESYVENPGLTLGGWFYSTDITSAQGLIGKFDASGDQRSYWVTFNSSRVLMTISSDGTSSNTTAVESDVSLSSEMWYFVAARFIPATELAVNVNGAWTMNTVSIPSSIHAGSAAFQIGLISTLYLTGRVSLCFLCASALSDAMIAALWERGRLLFGV